MKKTLPLYIAVFFILFAPLTVVFAGEQLEKRKERERQVREQQLKAIQQGVIQQQKKLLRQRRAVQQRAMEKRVEQLNEVLDEVNPQIVDVKNLSDVMRRLETSSKIWPLLADRNPKIFIIDQYKKWYKEQDIVIRKPPEHYVGLIDDLLDKNPSLAQKPFREVLRFAAIIEYDFLNGFDQDMMIKNLLGEEGYKSNRKRLGKE